jgi:hypothetical protein
MKKLFVFLFSLIACIGIVAQEVYFDPLRAFNGRWSVLTMGVKYDTLEVKPNNILELSNNHNEQTTCSYYFQHNMLYLNNCGYLYTTTIENNIWVLTLTPAFGEGTFSIIKLRKKSF